MMISSMLSFFQKNDFFLEKEIEYPPKSGNVIKCGRTWATQPRLWALHPNPGTDRSRPSLIYTLGPPISAHGLLIFAPLPIKTRGLPTDTQATTETHWLVKWDSSLSMCTFFLPSVKSLFGLNQPKSATKHDAFTPFGISRTVNTLEARLRPCLSKARISG